MGLSSSSSCISSAQEYIEPIYNKSNGEKKERKEEKYRQSNPAAPSPCPSSPLPSSDDEGAVMEKQLQRPRTFTMESINEVSDGERHNNNIPPSLPFPRLNPPTSPLPSPPTILDYG